MEKDITSVKYICKLLDKYGIKAKKRLGQHFILSSQVLKKIVELAEIKKEDSILEIGPGLGALTYYLSKAAGEVVAVEVDTSLFPLLEETLAGQNNIRLVQGDILKLNLDTVMNEGKRGLDKKYKVVGNLPYYITGPIIMSILEGDYQVESLVIMVQKEVAERMMAQPSSKEYGLLTIGVQFYAEVLYGGLVPRHAFWPQPKVDSVFVKLILRKEPVVKVISREFFFWTARAAFGQRRKTLSNALIGAPGAKKLNREIVDRVLQNIDIDPKRRGETLSLKELAKVSNHLYPICR